MSIEELERQLLELPSHERARLAERLIASLDEDVDLDQAAVDEAWRVEIQRRLEAVDRGEVALVPAEEVMAQLSRRFDR